MTKEFTCMYCESPALEREGNIVTCEYYGETVFTEELGLIEFLIFKAKEIIK